MKAEKQFVEPEQPKTTQKSFFFNKLINLLYVLLVFSSVQAVLAAAIANTDAGTIKGTIVAVAGTAANAQSATIAGARLTLINKASVNGCFQCSLLFSPFGLPMATAAERIPGLANRLLLLSLLARRGMFRRHQ